MPALVRRRAAIGIAKRPSAAGNWVQSGWQLPGSFRSSKISQARRTSFGRRRSMPCYRRSGQAATAVSRLGVCSTKKVGYLAKPRNGTCPQDSARWVNDQWLRIKIWASKTPDDHTAWRPQKTAMPSGVYLRGDSYSLLCVRVSSGVPDQPAFQHAAARLGPHAAGLLGPTRGTES